MKTILQDLKLFINLVLLSKLLKQITLTPFICQELIHIPNTLLTLMITLLIFYNINLMIINNKNSNNAYLHSNNHNSSSKYF